MAREKLGEPDYRHQTQAVGVWRDFYFADDMVVLFQNNAVFMITRGVPDRVKEEVRDIRNHNNDEVKEDNALAPEQNVAENEWYVLWERPIDKNRSYFRSEVLKPDAQLGIGIGMDIAKVANTRGFKFFSIGASQADTNLVTFYQTHPQDIEKVLEVDVFMKLADTLSVLPDIADLKPIDRPDEKGFSKLHRAVMQRNTEAVQTLLDQGADVNVRQREFQGTPLQYAAARGDLKAVQLLIKHNAMIDAVDTNGRTPLIWAASKGRKDVVKLLLDAGANIHKTNRGNWTALHYAADKGHLETAQLLIERGANLAATNSNGDTPIDMNADITPSE